MQSSNARELLWSPTMFSRMFNGMRANKNSLALNIYSMTQFVAFNLRQFLDKHSQLQGLREGGSDGGKLLPIYRSAYLFIYNITY